LLRQECTVAVKSTPMKNFKSVYLRVSTIKLHQYQSIQKL